MSDLATRTELVDVSTGEFLPATPENAHRALTALNAMSDRLKEVRAAVTEYLIEESRRQGTKTLHTPGGDLVLSGGRGTEYDAEALAECLREAGCPEERIDEVVTAEITYKVNRSVLRQLTAANEDYQAAAELARRDVEKPFRASAK